MRTAIVTGGASGIGRALGVELARRGVEVTLADRQVELAEEVAATIHADGGSARAAELDVRDLARFRDLVEETLTRAGRLDYLFNNAGIGIGGEMRLYTDADWDDVIDVNLRGIAHGILSAYPRMIEQGFGHIVNTASMAGLVTTFLQGSYTATKHAVVALSRSLRIEAKPYGVRVSVLCPGVIRTPILDGGRYGRTVNLGLTPEQAAAQVERLRPMDSARFAQRALVGVERNRAIIIVPGWWRLLWYVERLSPWLADRLGEAGLHQALRRIASLRAPGSDP